MSGIFELEQPQPEQPESQSLQQMKQFYQQQAALGIQQQYGKGGQFVYETSERKLEWIILRMILIETFGLQMAKRILKSIDPSGFSDTEINEISDRLEKVLKKEEPDADIEKVINECVTEIKM
jgi:hypothetical protein